MSTLHVIDGHRAPWSHLHALAELSRHDGHAILLIGNTSDARRAAHAGILEFHRVQAPLNIPERATLSINRAVRSIDRSANVRPWDRASARAVNRQAAPAPPDSIAGAFPERTFNREGVRTAWSLADGVLAIIPANDRPRDVCAMRLTYIAGILSTADCPAVAVVPSVAKNMDRAARFAWGHNRSRWIVVDDRSPLHLRDAADACWWKMNDPPDTASTLAMLARAGLPCVADRCDRSEAIEDPAITLCNPASELAPSNVLSKETSKREPRSNVTALIEALEADSAVHA